MARKALVYHGPGAKDLDVQNFVTHRFTLNQMLDACDTFTRAAETNAVKIVLHG